VIPTDRQVPWEALRTFEWLDRDDVSGRTLVELLRAPAWAELSPDDRDALWLGAVLAPGDRSGRRRLWERGVPFAVREQACGLARFHRVPTALVDHPDPLRLACALSLACRADLLALLAEATVRAGGPGSLDDVALFRVFCEERGCLRTPFAFPSDHTRTAFFRSRGRAPDVLAHDDTRAELVLMSGLPGAGKGSWVRANVPELPVVSLDDLREELGVAPDADQGTVRQVATERVRAHLRRGTPFVHDATNLDRDRRAPLLALAADYRFRVRIVYVEVPVETLLSQNRGRDAVVPERVIWRMAERWEVPDLSEAHRVERVVRGG
jgi:predicted kinase